MFMTGTLTLLTHKNLYSTSQNDYTMSKEGLAMVLGKAVVDRDFLDRLKANPVKVAKEVTSDLTTKELQYVKTRMSFKP
jgi:hypothetical protein